MAGRGVRVTGGRLVGRRLRAPTHGVRPSADRMRESLFARLGDLGGAAVLDLYAGTGALGAEAASRGADRVVFVERAAASLRVLRENLSALGLEPPRFRVVAGDAVAALRRLGGSGERFDLVLVDPPYGEREVRRALTALPASGVLAEAAMVVVEHGRRHPVPPVPGLVVLDERRYGDTAVTRLLAEPDDSTATRAP